VKPLRLTLRYSGPQRLNLYGLVPDRLLEMTPSELAQHPVRIGDEPAQVADCFEIADGNRQRLVLAGDLARADYVGGGMRAGELEVLGSVGHYAATGMRDGRLWIEQSAGEYLSSDQRGGTVEVLGNAGRGCAAARPGARRGMRGGTLLLHGQAGDGLAARLRRGIVVVHGRVRGDAGSFMIAGTLVLLDQVEGLLGVGMRRGTILTLAETMPRRHAGFTPAEAVELSYLPMLVRACGTRVQEVWNQRLTGSCTLFRAVGDRASSGVGELLWLSQQEKDWPLPV
jgi:formylmethanofuran dehydrogenase subunit C